MAKALVGALALAALPSALAFSNTSPFLFFSTSDLPFDNGHASFSTHKELAAAVTKALEGCPSRTYLLVHQPGVSSSDYLNSRSWPRLSYHLSGDDDVKTRSVVPEVAGNAESELEVISDYIQQRCDAQVLRPARELPEASDSKRIIHLSFPSPPATPGRGAVLGKHDAVLDDYISRYTASQDYTVIYATTPSTEKPVEVQEASEMWKDTLEQAQEAVHMELKRDFAVHARKPAHQEGGLFEKYSFFSPGIFMALTAALPLFLVLFVGIRAIASLEVSYFAFSKEMGPAAQRKQG